MYVLTVSTKKMLLVDSQVVHIPLLYSLDRHNQACVAWSTSKTTRLPDSSIAVIVITIATSVNFPLMLSWVAITIDAERIYHRWVRYLHAMVLSIRDTFSTMEAGLIKSLVQMGPDLKILGNDEWALLHILYRGSLLVKIQFHSPHPPDPHSPNYPLKPWPHPFHHPITIVSTPSPPQPTYPQVSDQMVAKSSPDTIDQDTNLPFTSALWWLLQHLDTRATIPFSALDSLIAPLPWTSGFPECLGRSGHDDSESRHKT